MDEVNAEVFAFVVDNVMASVVVASTQSNPPIKFTHFWFSPGHLSGSSAHSSTSRQDTNHGYSFLKKK